MAVLVQLKNRETGATRTAYTVDAREMMKKDPKTGKPSDWEYVKRLPRSARKGEVGTPGGNPTVVFDPVKAALGQGGPAQPVGSAPSGAQSLANAMTGEGAASADGPNTGAPADGPKTEVPPGGAAAGDGPSRGGGPRTAPKKS